ncbi:hypothetical protein O181_023853 [Austropuccinia psidii MF-1]|uniref:t-SNARE coiled-coil homology domain-containing protein n=1 Tax=Austropuccinia psidii MF-1 TaxID=1389203 RepID=A0A9Q3CJL6_9BASI|nr:hypothetical protein [Austropuccinia psidii MF-1]
MNCFSNRTQDFRDLVADKKKLKLPLIDSQQLKPITKQSHARKAATLDSWTKEAQLVARSIQDLLDFLNSIQRAYWNPTPSHLNQSSNHSKNRVVDIQKGSQGFTNVQWFSEKEKDEIDVLVGVGLKKSIESVRALEAAEKTRKSRNAERQSNHLIKLLRISIDSRNLQVEQFDSHRASILWFLNQKLTQLGKLFKTLQETRAKKKHEKAMKSGLAGMLNASGSSFSAGAFQSKISQSEPGHIPEAYRPKLIYDSKDVMGEEPPIESVLTPSQIQQFESESSALLEATENTLASIKKTESSLMEISNLQTELVQHLTQQTEMIDQLWDDAVVSTGKIEQGNKQLLRAKESNQESRVWLLIFILGSSFALLLVDYLAP